MNEKILSDIFPVPMGWVGITLRNTCVVNIRLGTSKTEIHKALRKAYPSTGFRKMPAHKRQIVNFLSGKSNKLRFNFVIENVTPLQKKILLSLQKIPYGKTISYAMLGAKIGNRHLARAVGTAMAQNPLPLIIPCHRVIKSNGSQGGFMGKKNDVSGWKSELLQMESKKPGRSNL